MSKKYKLKIAAELKNKNAFDKFSFLLSIKSSPSLAGLSNFYFRQWRMQKHNMKERKDLKEKQEE